MIGERGRAPGRSSAVEPVVAAPTGSPGKTTLVAQLQAAPQRPATAPDGGALDAAAKGVSGAGSALPHLDIIQSAFGRHDLSGVTAHAGPEAVQANRALGAEAYATDGKVAFAGASPSLHTAAHEAAHVVQQRGGVQLKDGVGQSGDGYEHHADAVADAVVAGKSAEGLLDAHAGTGAGNAVQRSVVQRKDELAMTQSHDVSDGPYGWTSAYDILITDTEVIVTIGAQVTPDPGVTPAQVRRVQQVTATEFQRYWDSRFNMRDASGTARPLRVRLDFASAAPHLQIALHTGEGRDDLSNWFVDSQPIDRAHELGHQLGLKDEYVDAAAPDRATGASPGVFTDHSIMGSYPTEGVGQADVRQRHGDQIASDISAATGTTFTAERRSTYIVRQGDTLSAIAARTLGDGTRWPEIHALNRDRIRDPNLILPGWELKLP
jgi:nucleoid-associated protein YgaU